MSHVLSLSYRKQIEIYRRLALEAVAKFPITFEKIVFINHGENTTFRVFDKSNGSYLMRVCRDGYHTPAALNEELKWVRDLSRLSNVQVPTPILSRAKKLFEVVKTTEVPEGRKVALFKWTDGRFLVKRVNGKHMQELAQVLAKLHDQSPNYSVVHRRYWDAEGLLGKKAKFGNIDDLQNLSREEQREITKRRQIILKKLKSYEKKNPHKMGIIHSDIHSGNFIFNKEGVALIDFDDCGFGFFCYDMAIIKLTLSRFKLSKKEKDNLMNIFFESYRMLRPLDDEDIQIVDLLAKARRLLMLGWLNSRLEIPHFKTHFRKAVKRALREV